MSLTGATVSQITPLLQNDNTVQWACARCTFDNHCALPSCELCELPRPSSVPWMVPKKRRRRHHLPRLDDPPLRNQAQAPMHPSAVPILEDDLRCAVVGVLQGTHNATEAVFHTSRALCDDARNARIKRSSSVRRPSPPGHPELFAGELSYDEGVLSGTSDVWTKRGACVFPSMMVERGG